MHKLLLSKRVKQKKHSKNEWKVLIVDDDAGVHQVTELALKHFEYKGRGLEFISAYSAQEAKAIIGRDRDIAVVLLDVVMETENAGFDVVAFIRGVIGNKRVRIILCTGNPEYAPERYVIDHYDINDYREKSNLTQDKLYAAIYMGLKTYDDITTLNSQRRSLEYIAQAAPAIFKIATLDSYFRSILTAIIDLLGISEENRNIESLSGFIAYPITDCGEYKVCHGINSKDVWEEKEEKISHMLRRLHPQLNNMRGVFKEGTLAIAIKDKNEIVAAILLENIGQISDHGRRLLNILSMQASCAFKNIDLFELLSMERQETINKLAAESEVNDENTSKHIRRIENLTRLLALELMLSRVIAKTHHEHCNGGGCQCGLSSDELSLSGRITALADVCEALVSKRPYKDAWPLDDVLELIRSERAKDFDPKVVDELFRFIEK
jgi:response regulator RpfG family c-di-GMP phosphodiesterase